MKNIFKSGILSLTAIFMMVACAPQEDDKVNLGNVVPASDIKVNITVPNPQKPNEYHFELETPKCVGIFSCPDAGVNQYTGLEFTQYVPWAGAYNMIVSVYNKAGVSESVSVPFTVNATDPAICENDLFHKLTGGCDAPNGKTWRIDGSKQGHIGCGPGDANSNEWWNPAPFELTPTLYDDDIIFILNAQQHCILNNKGASFMNESTAALFPDGNSEGSFVTTHYTPSSTASWAITKEGGSNWLVMSKAFPAYAVNPAAVNGGKYKIIEMTETDMHIVYLPGGTSWHYFLTSKPR